MRAPCQLLVVFSQQAAMTARWGDAGVLGDATAEMPGHRNASEKGHGDEPTGGLESTVLAHPCLNIGSHASIYPQHVSASITWVRRLCRPVFNTVLQR